MEGRWFGIMISAQHTTHIGYRKTYGGHYADAPFGISLLDRFQHVFVLGKTGRGKSTLLRNIALQDIHAGHGLAFIDPHGDDAEFLLDNIPGHRIPDVIYFNPADTEYPLPLNPLAQASPDATGVLATSLTTTFKKIYGDFWGPRLHRILRNDIAAHLEKGKSTLLGVLRMLYDERYRQYVAGKVHDPIVRRYWTQKFPSYRAHFQAEITESVENKIEEFVSNPLIRNILGQVTSSFDFSYITNHRKIFIANLSKGKIGEANTRLLGALLVTMIQQAIMERAHIPESERVPFFVILDEAHNFVSEAVATALGEARKYRMGLVMATQHSSALHQDVRNAIIGNVGTLIAFTCGSNDAELLAPNLGEDISPTELTSLGRYEIALRPAAGSDMAPEEAFKARTLEPIEFGYGHSRAITLRSRRQYARPRHVVEQKIERWMQPGPKHIYGKRKKKKVRA